MFFLTSNAQSSFYIACDNSDLIKADIQTCSYQIICNTGLVMFDVAITPNQNFYSTDGQKIYNINLSDCSYIQRSDTIPINGQWITSLVALNNEFLFAGSSDALLYKISVLNGAYTLIGSIGYSSGGDLTWYNDKLYLASASSDLVQITLINDYNNISEVKLIGHMNTPFSSMYGTLTIGDAGCSYDNIKMLGFENQDIYLINPFDATLQPLCISIFPCQVYGATSNTEINLQDYSSELEMPNVFSPNNDDLNDLFKPIQEKNIKKLNLKIFNRWGVKIFETESLNTLWDGRTMSAERAPDGVYYYIIEYEDICNIENNKKGFIQLVR
ncbi:MAG: gliding motility-associated C-terminal domain-containing protein [Bacteroidota bacterium]